MRGPGKTSILLAMNDDPDDLETLRRGARLAEFTWSDAELEEIRPMVIAGLRVLHALEAAPIARRRAHHALSDGVRWPIYSGPR